MLPSFYQVPRKWATQHARPVTHNPNPDRARRASTKASAPAPIVPKPAGTITLFEADPTTPTAEVSAEVVQTTQTQVSATKQKQTPIFLEAKLQDAGWKPDVELWDTDTDSNCSEEGDLDGHLELNPEQIRALCM